MSTLPAAPAPRRTRRGARLRLLVCLGIIVAALGWVSARGLTGSLVYYLAPSDLVTRHEADPGQRVRLGGYVVPGSVERVGSDLRFTVTDGTDSIGVVSTGPVPELFRAGQGVVLEGELGPDHAFHSDTLLVKHNGEYQPPAPGQRPPSDADLDAAG